MCTCTNTCELDDDKTSRPKYFCKLQTYIQQICQLLTHSRLMHQVYVLTTAFLCTWTVPVILTVRLVT